MVIATWSTREKAMRYLTVIKLLKQRTQTDYIDDMRCEKLMVQRATLARRTSCSDWTAWETIQAT